MAKVEKGFLAKLRSMMLHMKDVRTEDGKNLQVDGDELEVGKEILIESDGEWTPAPDGEYDTGEVILRVEAGKIAEIRAKNADPEPDPEPENMSAKFQRIAAAFAESYEERTKKIAAAIVALGFDSYGYLVSCGDDFAIYATWNEGSGEKYTRFDVSWDADGNAVVSNPTEVKPAFVEKEGEPAGEPAPSAEEEALRRENADLKAQLAKLSKTPAGRRAHDEVNDAPLVTGNKGIDRIAALMAAKKKGTK